MIHLLNSYTLALILSSDGLILEVKKPLDRAIHFEEDTHLVHYLDEPSYETFLELLSVTNQVGYSLGGQLTFKSEEDIITMSIGLLAYEDTIVLMSLNESENTLSVLNEVIEINNQQTNLIRKIYSNQAIDKDQRDQINQISKLNSELVNVQRELAQKNGELARLNKELKKQSLVDYLTDIPNRRKFFSDIYAFVLDAPYDLIMMDFNNFKIINDTLGHDHGDKVLKGFASKIDQIAINEKGKAYRLGGDEFAMLIPRSQAFNFESVIDSLNDYVKTHHDSLSIAYGIEEVNKDNVNESNRAEDIMVKADHQMYEHKFNLKHKQ